MLAISMLLRELEYSIENIRDRSERVVIKSTFSHHRFYDCLALIF